MTWIFKALFFLGSLSPLLSGGGQDDLVKYVRVKEGDTVLTLAHTHHVTPREIVALNGLTPPFKIYISQILMVPPPFTYKVKTGDSLTKIARFYGLTPESLISMNQLSPPYRAYAGQVLYIPRLKNWHHGLPPESPRTHSPVFPRPKPKAPRSAGTKKNTIEKLEFSWPIQGKVFQHFSAEGPGRRNDGINILAKSGTLIRASEKGKVVYIGSGVKGFGNLILLKHNHTFVTAYAHCGHILVERNQSLEKGTPIAKVGRTGGVKDPQLHFEIRKHTKPVNPLLYLGS